MSLTQTIKKLMAHQDLSFDECQTMLDDLLQQGPVEQIAAALVLLHSKGETVEELYAMVDYFRQQMRPLTISEAVIDIVGTGGDGFNTVNISTATALLVAGCGVKVVKHGNRAVSSLCGSADVLEALGVRLELKNDELIKCIQNYHMGFCYAPLFHPVLLQLKSIRNHLGVPTTLNLLGPLLNPARASYFLLGVSKPQYLSLFAKVLQKLSVEHALVVHSCGLDEISLLGVTQMVEVRNGEITSVVIDPRDYGFNWCSLTDIQGGNAKQNAQTLVEVFQGKDSPIAQTILLNAGAALYAANQAETIAAGIDKARHCLQAGQAYQTLQGLIQLSKKETHYA